MRGIFQRRAKIHCMSTRVSAANRRVSQACERWTSRKDVPSSDSASFLKNWAQFWLIPLMRSLSDSSDSTNTPCGMTAPGLLTAIMKAVWRQLYFTFDLNTHDDQLAYNEGHTFDWVGRMSIRTRRSVSNEGSMTLYAGDLRALVYASISFSCEQSGS
jgi:hypothetical protein